MLRKAVKICAALSKNEKLLSVKARAISLHHRRLREAVKADPQAATEYKYLLHVHRDAGRRYRQRIKEADVGDSGTAAATDRTITRA